LSLQPADNGPRLWTYDPIRLPNIMALFAQDLLNDYDLSPRKATWLNLLFATLIL
jgi:hypothetical protein